MSLALRATLDDEPPMSLASGAWLDDGAKVVGTFGGRLDDEAPMSLASRAWLDDGAKVVGTLNVCAATAGKVKVANSSDRSP